MNRPSLGRSTQAHTAWPANDWHEIRVQKLTVWLSLVFNRTHSIRMHICEPFEPLAMQTTFFHDTTSN